MFIYVNYIKISSKKRKKVEKKDIYATDKHLKTILKRVYYYILLRFKF